MIKLTRETYTKSEWVLIINEISIPVHPLFLGCLIVLSAYLVAISSQIVAQNQAMMYQEFKLARPECSVVYDLGKLIIDCPKENKNDFSKGYEFNITKNISIIND